MPAAAAGSTLPPVLASNSALVGAFEDGASVEVTAVASTAELTPAAVLVTAELLAEPPSADVLEAAELLLDPPLPAEVLVGAALLVGAVLLGPVLLEAVLVGPVLLGGALLGPLLVGAGLLGSGLLGAGLLGGPLLGAGLEGSGLLGAGLNGLPDDTTAEDAAGLRVESLLVAAKLAGARASPAQSNRPVAETRTAGVSERVVTT